VENLHGCAAVTGDELFKPTATVFSDGKAKSEDDPRVRRPAQNTH